MGLALLPVYWEVSIDEVLDTIAKKKQKIYVIVFCYVIIL